MALASGTKLGPYEIQSPLGAGGMGEVYRARDTRLDRTVAVKILPSHLSANPDAKQRFDREARVISSLSHPNICHLYDVGSQDGIDYLVMEFLEGENLADRLRRGPLPPEQVLRYAMEICDGLEKAHRSGVIHRDLKPGNIMLTKTGVKLMDFGLAKAVNPSTSGLTATLVSAEAGQPLTAQGTVLGTFQYMAPEQVEGKEADRRSDIFSLGAVLYEMATAQRAFEGKTAASTIAAILAAEPKPISAIQPLSPPMLDSVVKGCLVKDPDDRLQTAHDVKLQLKWIAESSGQTARPVQTATAKESREALAWVVCGALTAILIAGAIRWQNSKPPEQNMYFPAPLSFPARDVSVAPNGHTIAVVAYRESAGKNAIWIYELGSQGPRSLADTEGASYPFWSADGRFLAFFADGKLKKLDVSGGQVQVLCDAPSGRGGTWNKDGVIVFTPDASPGGSLYRVSASGGTPTRISNPDANRGESSHRWPLFLPDGKHYLYMAANFAGRKDTDAIFVGSLDSNEKRFVVQATANAAYAAPGYLVFYHDKTLLAQPFDLKRFALTGEATTLLTEIQYQPQVARAVFAVSDSGLLVAQTGSGVALSQPVWFDRKGNDVGAVGKPDVYGNVSIAPNGRSVALDKTEMESQNIDIWEYELQRDSAKRLTFGVGFEMLPVWSPDGTRLVYSSNQMLGTDLYMKNADGTQEEKSIAQDEFAKFSSDWSRDGKHILYNRGTDLWLLTLPELKASLFLKAMSILRDGRFSPDGRWVAYASNETGKWEIYVTSFPEARGKWQVSTGGGEQPRWRGDGKELFYLSSDRKMMAVSVTAGANFDADPPVALFQATPRQPVTSTDQSVYDVTRDGQRFLINTPVKQVEAPPMSVVLNWSAKLNRK
jgi:eukaryotic-like serine/threonine-protein kinase